MRTRFFFAAKTWRRKVGTHRPFTTICDHIFRILVFYVHQCLSCFLLRVQLNLEKMSPLRRKWIPQSPFPPDQSLLSCCVPLLSPVRTRHTDLLNPLPIAPRQAWCPPDTLDGSSCDNIHPSEFMGFQVLPTPRIQPSQPSPPIPSMPIGPRYPVCFPACHRHSPPSEEWATLSPPWCRVSAPARRCSPRCPRVSTRSFFPLLSFPPFTQHVLFTSFCDSKLMNLPLVIHLIFFPEIIRYTSQYPNVMQIMLESFRFVSTDRCAELPG